MENEPEQLDETDSGVPTGASYVPTEYNKEDSTVDNAETICKCGGRYNRHRFGFACEDDNCNCQKFEPKEQNLCSVCKKEIIVGIDCVEGAETNKGIICKKCRTKEQEPQEFSLTDKIHDEICYLKGEEREKKIKKILNERISEAERKIKDKSSTSLTSSWIATEDAINIIKSVFGGK